MLYEVITRFWTGDLAVRHPDGYIEVKDRSKDVIISGGENGPELQHIRGFQLADHVITSYSIHYTKLYDPEAGNQQVGLGRV